MLALDVPFPGVGGLSLTVHTHREGLWFYTAAPRLRAPSERQYEGSGRGDRQDVRREPQDGAEVAEAGER